MNRCMYTKTENKISYNEHGLPYYKQQQCENMTDKEPNPKNNNRVYCDSCQEKVDKINKEKFKGYIKKEKLIKYINDLIELEPARRTDVTLFILNKLIKNGEFDNE